jgi:hypothetical protein
MRLIAEDIITGVMIEFYPKGLLYDVMTDTLNAMEKDLKNKEIIEHKILHVETKDGEKIGLFCIGPKVDVKTSDLPPKTGRRRRKQPDMMSTA